MYTLIIITRYLLFFITEYKNEHREHKFKRQKKSKNDFYKSKKMVQRMHLNTLLDIMIMMLLDHYVYSFHK